MRKHKPTPHKEPGKYKCSLIALDFQVFIEALKERNYRLAWLAAKAMVSDTLNPGK